MIVDDKVIEILKDVRELLISGGCDDLFSPERLQVMVESLSELLLDISLVPDNNR